MPSPGEIAAYQQIKDRFSGYARRLKNKNSSLIDWGQQYLPDYFFRTPSRFHVELSNEFDRLRYARRQNTVVIAPRGNAKTTITQTSVLRDICEENERYILIISDSEEQGIKILDMIRLELESNEKLRQTYPLACKKGYVWNKTKLETSNGVCIEALGTGSKVRGRKYRQYRPTKIILDDPDNDEDVKSATTRANHIEWFDKALTQCGDRDTNIVVVGTMIHRECIVGHLEHRMDFKTIKFGAIMKWPDRMDLWSKWEDILLTSPKVKQSDGSYQFDSRRCDMFYDTHYDEMVRGAEVLWEEKESLVELMMMRATKGHAVFASEKQNEPRDPSKCEFKEEWFNDEIMYDYEELQNKVSKQKNQKVSIMYADPAKGGETKKHDYSPIFTLHKFATDPYVYIECNMQKIPVSMLCDLYIDLYKINECALGGFEANGFQQLVGDQIYLKAKEKNCHSLNLVEIEHYGIHKNTRISRLSVFLERHYFRFRRDCPHTKLLIQQLKDHPNAEHDDGSDALEALLRLFNNVYDFDQEQAMDNNQEQVVGRVN